MAKLSRDSLRKSIHTIIETAEKANADYLETISVKFTLKNYDPNKNRPLNSKGDPIIHVCVLGDQEHCEEAAKFNVPFINFDELGTLNRNTRLMKQLSRRFDAFLASDTIMDEIRSILGPGLSKISKTLGVLIHGECMTEKVEEMKLKICEDIKKVLFVTAEIGHVKMTPEKLEENVLWAANYLVPRLKKNWRNVKSLCITSTSGPAYPLEVTF
ncbi:60S ribosomal protein L10a-like [Pararge aegeria]|uniref:Large ribosomal subunit protein uL1 n=1 Tax=Pararge aegeria aegeria TaxID=348720 RepID=A0A8S4QHM9_9NEOP|nr:60S ribosomal protein L10a-like [Pararge aegeria]CAH2209502.1 jg3574 [Pararge aegeria aegeria]